MIVILNCTAVWFRNGSLSLRITTHLVVAVVGVNKPKPVIVIVTVVFVTAAGIVDAIVRKTRSSNSV